MAASPGRGSRILAGRRLSTGRAARRDRLNTVTLGAQSALGPGDRVQTGTRALLVAFAVFTLLAVSSLLVLGEQTDTFFAWTIRSGPNAAFLGAAYAAGLVLSVLAVRQRRWSRVRVPLITVTAFAVLTLIPTLLHMHRLHLIASTGMPRFAAGVWLAVYVLVPVACGVVVVRQSGRQRGQEEVLRRMPRRLVTLPLAQGAVLATVGAVLYAGGATMHTMTEVQRPGWPWPVTPLTSQVIGAWMLSFGFGIAVVVRERDLSRLFVPAVAYAAFGLFELLVLLSYRAAPGTDGRRLWLDVVVLATLVPTGAYGAWIAHRVREEPAPEAS
jgi:hypothetical protein